LVSFIVDLPPKPHSVASGTALVLSTAHDNPVKPKNETEGSARKGKRKKRKKEEKNPPQTIEQLELKFLRLPREGFLIMIKGKPPRNAS